eukprot:149833_1
MGNKHRNKQTDNTKHTKNNKKHKLNSSNHENDPQRTSVSSSHNQNRQYTYAEILTLIEDELLNYVPIDLSTLILSFIPRSTIGDESNPINPYDVLNIHVHLLSPYPRIPLRVLSIFNSLSPNCHCGGVLIYNEYQEIIDYKNDSLNKKQLLNMKCGRCNQLIGRNILLNCYNAYFECPSINNKHCNKYKICEKCIYENIEIYVENNVNLFEGYYKPKCNNNISFDSDESVYTLKTQRRVCLAFTEDYVRVYLHCFKAPQNKNENDFSKALYTSNYNWRDKKNNYDLNEVQIGILLDDFNEKNWEIRGKDWIDYMEIWSGGNNDSIFIALCHCNQINNKITNIHKQRIENYLYDKQIRKHSNIHDKGNTIKKRNSFGFSNENKNHLRNSWSNLSNKLFVCSITENEDTITAILDIVGGFLSNLTEREKVKLTYRGKFDKNRQS